MTKSMGKGTIYLMLAQIIFILASYTIHFGLGRLLGPKQYGIFGIVFSILAVIEIFLIRGFREAVSKYVSEFDEKAKIIKKKALKIELILSGIFFIVFFFSAKQIASILHDVNLTNYIRLSSIIIPFLALNSVYLGYLSGLKHFGKQSISMCAHSLSKVVFVYLFVLLGFKVYGAIGGYIAASIIALLTASYFSRNKNKKSTNDFQSHKLIKFAIPIILFSGIISIIMNLDLILVKALISGTESTGIYTSASAITRAPYYIFLALAFTLLPSISKSTASNNLAQTKEYINKSLRYLLMLVLPLAFFISSAAKEIIKLTYSKKYILAASPLSILIFGITFITIFYILTTIIIGSGKPGIPMVIAFLLVPLDFVLNLLLIPQFKLNGAALSTTITCFVGMVITAIYVKRKFGTLTRLSSFVKILVGSLILFIIPQFFIVSGLFFIVYAFLLFGLYVLILIVLGEINREDIKFFLGMFPNRFNKH